MRSAAPSRLRLCLLASGSNGNAFLAEAAETRVLVDLGIGPRVLARRLEPLGLVPADIAHVLLTHAHVDHVRGLEGLLKRREDLVVHASRATARSLPDAVRARVRPLRAGRAIPLGALTATPFLTSHDAAHSVGYRIQSGGLVVGYATDLGSFGQRVVEGLSGAQALVVESNHCAQMLAEGSYPPYLKRRVAGERGHLSNAQCRDLLGRLVHPGLRHVILAHLSGENNTPARALGALAGLREAHPQIRWAVGSRSGPLEPVVLTDPGVPPETGQLALPM